MCGIFGILASENANISSQKIEDILKQLYQLSESRGKESAGLYAYLPEHRKTWTLKGDISATSLIKTPQYKKVIASIISSVYSNGVNNTIAPFALLAHSRLVTNGAAENYHNNQPVRHGNATVIHNGIVVNIETLWAKNSYLNRNADVDTEIIAAFADHSMSDATNLVAATRNIYLNISGTASIAWSDNTLNSYVLATNTGDLYFLINSEKTLLIFASERYILEQIITKNFTNTPLDVIQWISAGNGIEINLTDFAVIPFSLFSKEIIVPINIKKYLDPVIAEDLDVSTPHLAPDLYLPKADESLIRYNENAIRSIKRCTCCVLPETFPFITFDPKGVCNYCKNYKPKYKGLDPDSTKKAFFENIRHYKKSDGKPDVLVPFSGGRDSCYGLHLIKNEFGFNPITFTYDWGMVTDLARRNIARLCGQLGVQNILVSADIRKKRQNIHNNVSAWLKQPDLGMVPLFMAGDKHFFKIVNQLKRQTGIRLDLWAANPLENTDFKSGFCGVEPDFDKLRVDHLSLTRKIRLASYYLSRFLMNPGYLNSSLLDSASAFASYYIEPRNDFFFMFNHLIWNENEVNNTLITDYDFELSPDSPSTWRIGDGTAPFYNYIYMITSGFTEFDTFRSNQIREGVINRNQALDLILIENRPRVASLRWYLEAIKLDFNNTINRINQLDKINLHL